MKNILLLIGPNLNLLGIREPEIYGYETLKDIENMCIEEGNRHGFEIQMKQSNYEGDLVTWIQEAREGADALMINAGAYTHTSIAIHDALRFLSAPIIEIHNSDPMKREKFRHISYIEPLAAKVIKGKGAKGYTEALTYLSSIL